jgi:hypothetical protein
MRILAFLAVAFLAGHAQAGQPTPLFASDETIDIAITGPINELVRKAAKSTDPYPATLSYGEETHAIELSARGKSRRETNCKFPPLRVKFTEKPPEGSLFRKQGTLKLVTHCRASASFQQYYLLEYAAYRMYNVLTPASYRVRLANVSYVNDNGKLVARRIGFFIEDIDDLADRVDMNEVEVPEVTVAQHDPAAAARAILFWHMIGNHDWSMLAGAPGEDCCHNGKLIGASKTATSGLVYVPYDFDYSGFVDAPYAVPPDAIPIRNVRMRYFRSWCSINDAVRAQAALFRAKKDAVYAAVDETPGLTASKRKKAARYLDGFFAQIADDAAVERNVIAKCR